MQKHKNSRSSSFFLQTESSQLKAINRLKLQGVFASVMFLTVVKLLLQAFKYCDQIAGHLSELHKVKMALESTLYVGFPSCLISYCDSDTQGFGFKHKHSPPKPHPVKHNLLLSLTQATFPILNISVHFYHLMCPLQRSFVILHCIQSNYALGFLPVQFPSFFL